MRRLLPKVWWIAMCSISICGYSRDLTFHESASESSHKLAFFQSETITGKVVDEAGLGMPGVNVIVKGTSNRNNNGCGRCVQAKRYSMSNLPVSLYFRLSVMQLRNNQSTIGHAINISMVADISELTEVVVVGYGTQEKRDVTSAISSMTGEAITQDSNAAMQWMQ